MSETGASTESMLVKIENLDKLLRLAGEVIISSSNLGLTYKNLHSLYEEKKPVNNATLDAVGDLATTTSDISSNLHHLVQAIRTVDLKDLSFRTRRVVRDISRKTGKAVNFEFEGEETTIDKTIVEKLYDPISHQLRNAIDHGIEDVLEREKAGKPPEGKISVKVYNSESETFVDIEDDGKGINMDSLMQKAIDKGRLLEGEPFTEDIALEMMCMAGVSTAKVVSEVSGRGVGMDVVRNHIHGLGGTITFKTEPGKGTVFTFRVPLVSAVNIVDALVVKSGKHLFGFPIYSVVSTMAVPKNEIHTTLQKGEMVKHLNSLLPLHSLNYLLDKETVEENSDTVSVLVIEHKGEQVALKITEFLSPQKLVIIPFDGALSVEGLAGTTVLGGRKLGFIIDITGLISRATGRAAFQATSGLKKAEGALLAGAKTGETKALEPTDKLEPQKEDYTAKRGLPSDSGDDEASDESVKEFIMEIENMLPELSETLFSLEGDPENLEKVNLAFRHFHTIKGNLIMIGFSKGGETVHSVESVLDFARSKKLELTPEVMDVLMDGVSYVEELVRAGKEGTWNDAISKDIVEASARLLPEVSQDQKAVVDVTNADIRLSHEASYRANNYRKDEVPFYQCYIEFDSGKQPPFLVACLIYKRVSEVADVLGTLPPLVDIENGLVERKLKLLFASKVDQETLEKALVTHLTAHYGASLVKMSSFR